MEESRISKEYMTPCFLTKSHALVISFSHLNHRVTLLYSHFGMVPAAWLQRDDQFYRMV